MSSEVRVFGYENQWILDRHEDPDIRLSTGRFVDELPEVSENPSQDVDIYRDIQSPAPLRNPFGSPTDAAGFVLHEARRLRIAHFKKESPQSPFPASENFPEKDPLAYPDLILLMKFFIQHPDKRELFGRIDGASDDPSPSFRDTFVTPAIFNVLVSIGYIFEFFFPALRKWCRGALAEAHHGDNGPAVLGDWLDDDDSDDKSALEAQFDDEIENDADSASNDENPRPNKRSRLSKLQKLVGQWTEALPAVTL